MATIKCDTCNTKYECTGKLKQRCENNGYAYYAPQEYGGVDEEDCKWPDEEGKATKRKNVPVSFIQIVVTDETKRLSGNQSNSYLFTSANFEVSTTNLCGKEFVQVREIKTGKPTLILDASTVLFIDYEWQP